MDLIAKERDRLLQRTARVYGLSFTAVSAVCLTIPGGVDVLTWVLCLPLYAVLSLALYRIGKSRSLGWVALGMAAGIGILLLITLVSVDGPGPSALSAASQLSAGALASFAVMLTTETSRRIVLGASFVVVTVLTVLLLAPAMPPLRTLRPSSRAPPRVRAGGPRWPPAVGGRRGHPSGWPRARRGSRRGRPPLPPSRATGAPR